MNGPLVVKKYGNRRLYDTAKSTYITLEELADRVRAGTEVRVVDAKTGEDLTQATLAQIILESRHGADLLPVPLLVQLIRMGDDALAEFFGRYVTVALEMYLQARQGMSMLPPNPFAPGAGNPFAQNPFGAVFGGMPGWGAPTAPAPAAPASPATPPPAGGRAAGSGPATHDDVVSLRKELDELKAALKRKR